MDKLLRKLSEMIVQSEKDQQLYNKYVQMTETEGWEVHKSYLVYLRGAIASEMLGKSFTKLPPDEKDSQQRAYAMADKLILFLLDPLQKAQQLAKIKWHNKLMEATMKRSDRKGSKKNG